MMTMMTSRFVMLYLNNDESRREHGLKTKLENHAQSRRAFLGLAALAAPACVGVLTLAGCESEPKAGGGRPKPPGSRETDAPDRPKPPGG